MSRVERRCRCLLPILPFLLAISSPAVSQTSEQISACLTKKGIASGDISLPGETDYTQTLAETLIQDPPSTPLIFVRPGTTFEVQKVVLCAKKLDVVICARGGGHSWAASSTCPGINIDMKKMLDFKTKRTTMTIGAGKTIGETVYQLYSTTGRIISVGTCPSVGVGGYIQGGGMGTLTGRLGLLADSVVRVKLVSPEGQVKVATKRKNTDLFWALRGGGGGYLGIVTEYKIKTAPAAGTFDNNVYFSYKWDASTGAEALHKWTKYSMNDNGDTYIRMTARSNQRGIFVRGMGVCWSVASVEECEQRLEKTELWSVPGRTTVLIQKAEAGAIEALQFFTVDGNYGTEVPSGPASTQEVFAERYSTQGLLSDRSWSSGMWDESMMKSDTDFFQGYIDLMDSQRANGNLRAIGMELYPLGKKGMKPGLDFSAFPHRNTLAVMAIFYSGGENDIRTKVKSRIQSYLSPLQKGTYVNYLDLDLSNYAEEYWGSNLGRMQAVKNATDPNLRMWHPQPL